MSRNISLVQAKEELKAIFFAAVKSVKPHNIIKNKVRIVQNNLYVDNKSYPLRDKVYMIGFGKAVIGMAVAMENLLQDRLVKGIISVPRGTKNQIWETDVTELFPKLTGVLSYRENSINNQPDDDTLSTTHDIINFVESLGNDDTLIVLISGGGSALLTLPHPAISAQQKFDLCKKLFNSGANIEEVNIIRQKLSMVKAGGLARIAYPASVIGLILSDIIGDPIKLIASGPTVYSCKAPEGVIKILKKYNIFDEIHGELKKVLVSKEVETDKLLLDEKNSFTHVHNIIIGNNSVAIEMARLESLRNNLNPIVLFNNVQGLVGEISAMYRKLCYLICQILMKSLSRDDFASILKEEPSLSALTEKSNGIYDLIQITEGQGLVLIAGGEPVVMVNGSGKGGRNQELALRFSIDWSRIIEDNPKLKMFNVVFLSAATDGQDGPTDAAGAFGYSEINSMACHLYKIIKNKFEVNGPKNMNFSMMKQLDDMIPDNVLKNNDSYTFYSRFRNGADLLKTGMSGTNVMDLHLIYINKSQYTCEHEHTANAGATAPFDEQDFFTYLIKNIEKKSEES